MTRIRCHCLECEFLDEGVCTAAQISIDADGICETKSVKEDIHRSDDLEEEYDEEEEGGVTHEDDEEDLWEDDEEEEEY